MAAQKSESEEKTERVILVGVFDQKDREWDAKDSLEELARLTDTAGGDVVERLLYKRRKPHPGLFLGRGKVEEVAAYVEEHEIDTVIFDEELTPAQGRNLEKIIQAKVIDRTQVILDIFASHAHTREGILQVELARLGYLLPRLRRMWTHLERQKGGIGLRGGPGEQQIEVDRRRVQERIARMKKELEKVRRHRLELRRGRRRHGWALISLVGYTNAGKSTLLNRLTDADVVTNDQLFVTLDPTTRKVELPNHQNVLLTDTVGFIRKLPHQLVEAFKATLEEVVESDLLVHVIDASHPDVQQQIDAVHSVLHELGAQHEQVLYVLNKADREVGLQRAQALAHRYRPSVTLSARTGEGVDAFTARLADCLKDRNQLAELLLPPRESKMIAAIKAGGNIIESEYEDDGALRIKVRLPERLFGQCRPFMVKNDEPGGKDEAEEF